MAPRLVAPTCIQTVVGLSRARAKHFSGLYRLSTSRGRGPGTLKLVFIGRGNGAQTGPRASVTPR